MLQAAVVLVLVMLLVLVLYVGRTDCPGLLLVQTPCWVISHLAEVVGVQWWFATFVF